MITARGGAYGPGTPREAWDFQTPYLRAYFGQQGVAEENICFVNAELTMVGLVPHLARFRPLADRSLAVVRAEVTALATAATGSASRATPAAADQRKRSLIAALPERHENPHGLELRDVLSRAVGRRSAAHQQAGLAVLAATFLDPE
jgi:hypothetical protein